MTLLYISHCACVTVHVSLRMCFSACITVHVMLTAVSGQVLHVTPAHVLLYSSS